MPGFDRKRHRIPETFHSSADGFVRSLCEPSIKRRDSARLSGGQVRLELRARRAGTRGGRRNRVRRNPIFLLHERDRSRSRDTLFRPDGPHFEAQGGSRESAGVLRESFSGRLRRSKRPSARQPGLRRACPPVRDVSRNLRWRAERGRGRSANKFPTEAGLGVDRRSKTGRARPSARRSSDCLTIIRCVMMDFATAFPPSLPSDESHV